MYQIGSDLSRSVVMLSVHLMFYLIVLDMSGDPCNISFFKEINEHGTVKFDENKIHMSF